MVKILQKSSSLEPMDHFPQNLVYSFGESSPSQFFSNDDLGLTLTYFTAWSKFVTWAFLWEKVKTVDFPETIAASDLKVGRYRQLIKLSHFLTVVQSYLHMKIKTCFSQKPLGHFQLNGVCNILGTRK